QPVINCKASGTSAERPTQTVYCFCPTATMLTMTPAVKATDSQRWVCRIHLFQFNGTSSYGSNKFSNAYRMNIRSSASTSCQARHRYENRPSQIEDPRIFHRPSARDSTSREARAE